MGMKAIDWAPPVGLVAGAASLYRSGMKSSGLFSGGRRLALAAGLLGLVAAGSAAESGAPAAAAPAPEPVTLLADLRTPMARGFVNGSWQGRVAVTHTGLLVLGNKGADGAGELGQDFEAPRDFTKVAFLEVALGTGLANEVGAVTLALDDASDTQYVARLRVDQLVPEQPVWLRVRRSDFQLNNWQGTKAGAVLDWSKITRWHLQGDWSKGKPFQVIFIALRYRQ